MARAAIGQLLMVTLLLLLLTSGGTTVAAAAASASEASEASEATAAAAAAAAKIVAVFDAAELETMERVMQKTLVSLNKEKPAWSGWTMTTAQPSSVTASAASAASSSSSLLHHHRQRQQQQQQQRRLVVHSVTFSCQWWTNQTADTIEKVMKLHQPIAVLVLSNDERAVFRVAVAAGVYHLPVIGARVTRGLDDSSFQGVSPYYVGLNPGPHHLASALHHLLLANRWLPVTLIVDDSLDAQRIRQVVLKSYQNTDKVNVVTMNRVSEPHRILAQLSEVQQMTSLVIAFCCDPRLASRLYREAAKLNMLNGDWVWLVLEQAAGRWSRTADNNNNNNNQLIDNNNNNNSSSSSNGSPSTEGLPLGLLGLVSQQPMRLSKHTMKGSLAILHSAIRSSVSLAQFQQAWSSSWADPSAPIGPLRLDMARKLHGEISWRVKEALAGRLTYDGGGKIDVALRANFDIVNLVAPGPFYPASSHASQASPAAARPRRQANVTQPDDDYPEPEVPEYDDSALMATAAAAAAAAAASASLRNQEENGSSSGSSGGGGQQRVASRPPVWQSVGNVSGQAVTFKGVQWPGGGLAGPRSHSRRVYRVATTFSPPFVMETEVFTEDDAEDFEEEEQRCLTGVPCLRVTTNQKDEMARIFGDYEGHRSMKGIAYNVTCCYGYAIDLMENVASDLDVNFQVYVVADGQCGAKRAGKWDGIVADLRSGAAHLSFAPLSVTSARSEVIDFSIPYFYSGLSILEATKRHDDVPLLAFLKPFSADLWIGIFVSLNVTALAVAVYEWLSPFGLNPWGRQRTKNFSLASALWVMWGLLFSHLVAFKAPKSWPNKFLINVWGGFSVIFLASYTANIAALFAGVFSETSVANFHDPRLLGQKVGTTRSSAAHHYALKTDRKLWEHLQKFTVPNLEEGVARLRDGRLDLLIGDTPILDYYRANDPGCTLRTVDVIEEDNYAVGMTKGLRLQTSISSLISSYSTSGYMDELRSKWYSTPPCARSSHDAYRPQALGVSAVAGVFILLGFGILAGCLILVLEHLVYKYALPNLRKQPKGTVWRSPNMMFFSQKLYRFINCVELLSPHHAAKELMNSLRQGQITSLFQKSVKRKEIEQKRRRKSKAQFFEMIREVRRYQQEEKDAGGPADEQHDDDDETGGCGVPGALAGSSSGHGPTTLAAEDDEEDPYAADKRRPSAASSNELSCRLVAQASASVAVSVAVASGPERVDDVAAAASVGHQQRARPEPLPPVADHPLRIADSERKWRMQAQRRRSFSADALCENVVHHRRHHGPRFVDSSASESSSSSDDSASQTDDGGSDDENTLLCSMVDRATLNKLTKQDVLLLWQAAEAEWTAKVRSLRKQRDIMRLRYQHAKDSTAAARTPTSPTLPPPPVMEF